MAKLTLLLATFTLFLLTANASIYRTTVQVDDENPSRQDRSCRQQIQEQQQLRHCQMLLRQQTTGDRRQNFPQCCQELAQLDSRCRCRGLEEAVRRQQQQGQLEAQEVEQLYEEANNIPRRCNLRPRHGCDLTSPYFSV